MRVSTISISRRHFVLSALGASFGLSACASVAGFGQLDGQTSPRVLIFPPHIALSVRGLGHHERPDRVRGTHLHAHLMTEAADNLSDDRVVPVLLDEAADWQRVAALTQLAHYVAAAGLNYDRRETGASDLPTRQIGLSLGPGGQGLAAQYGTDQALFMSLTGARPGFLQSAGEYIAEAGFGFDVPYEPRRMIVAWFNLQTGALVWARGRADRDVANPKRARVLLGELLRQPNQIGRSG